MKNFKIDKRTFSREYAVWNGKTNQPIKEVKAGGESNLIAWFALMRNSQLGLFNLSGLFSHYRRHILSRMFGHKIYHYLV